MESPSGTSPDYLSSLSEQDLRRLDFFVALRRLENGRQDLPRIGCASTPQQEVFRFAQEPSLAFAPTALERIEAGIAGQPSRLLVRFMGLFGPNGPLPTHLTDYARERIIQKRDPTFAGFLDIFHHRLLSLFYRAWAVNQQTVSFDRCSVDVAATSGDPFTFYCACLAGFGTDSIYAADSIPPMAKLFYSSWLAGSPRNPDGLHNIIEEFFQVKTRIEEFTHRWLPLPEQYQCRLGASPQTGCLGKNLFCGKHIWDVQNSFTVIIGPTNLNDYERMLPGSASHLRLRDWVKLYTALEFAWWLKLILKAAEVPENGLGVYGRLGYTIWLRTGPLDHDADEFQLEFSDAA